MSRNVFVVALQGKMSIHNSCLLIYRRNPAKISIKRKFHWWMMVSHGKSCHFHCDQWLFFWEFPRFISLMEDMEDMESTALPWLPPNTQRLLKKNRPAGNTGRCHGGQKEVGHVTGQILFVKMVTHSKKEQLGFQDFSGRNTNARKKHMHLGMTNHGSMNCCTLKRLKIPAWGTASTWPWWACRESQQGRVDLEIWGVDRGYGWYE